MAPIFIDYASPPQWKLEWRFLRLSVGALLFVFGWFCFSLYVWHCYGGYNTPRKLGAPLRCFFSLSQRIVQEQKHGTDSAEVLGGV